MKANDILLKHFKEICRDDVTVYVNPTFQVYVLRHKDGNWGIGSSLKGKNSFLYWHTKLGRHVVSTSFGLDNLFRLLDRKQIVTIDK